jgi:hypothetical protein
MLPTDARATGLPAISVNRLTRAVASLCRLTTARAAIVENARVARVRTDVLQSRRVAIVEVDAGHLAAVTRRHALDVDVSLALRSALSDMVSFCPLSIFDLNFQTYVSAGAVNLAVIFGVEVDDLTGHDSLVRAAEASARMDTRTWN